MPRTAGRRFENRKAGASRGKGRVGQRKREEGTQQGREGSKQEGETRGEGKVTEGSRDSGLHHPTTVAGENSYSLRRSGSLEDSNGWHEGWQC